MPGRRLSRRTTLGSALAAPIVLAGCDIDPPPRASGTSSATPEPPEDFELVATVVGSLVRALAVLDAASAAVPALGPRLDPVATAHAAHLDVLVGAVPEADVPIADPPRIAARPEAALAAVGRSEQRLLREVRAGCLGAASGDLARVLASVAASTSQHAASLATGAPR
ncbi:hypothetical protein [Nocardioides zhouii]|uniref:DUF4439 domain-containing protein n=1 Tax=Nocardioides zhouii TaxID=1168729 RepID=A0A4Q2T2C6_9ACTN|nr:hypothetical protein [Nocardioides zhouii]RYC12835.1 hypothetical protein EUA94_06240 [Nocardioides zhouii]